MFTPRVSAYSRHNVGSGKASKTSRPSLATSASDRRTSSAVHNRSQSLQTSPIIKECEAYTVEDFGMPLPVLVLEALIQVERCKDVSAKLDPSGWAWLVCGRRLFIWRFNLPSGQPLLFCRELTLPPSDLAHKADLVCVFCDDDRQVPSAVAVSPEGTVRHWPSIAQDGTSIEISAELQGQECFSLIHCQPFGCILATTTGTLMLITSFSGKSESTLSCRNLTVAKGVLARFGRRMSSFIFGGIQSQATEARLVRILVSSEPNRGVNTLFALTGTGLQKWEIDDNNTDQVLMDCDIDGILREKFIEQLWSRDLLHPQQLKTWLIDMQLSKFGLFILASAVSPKEPHRMRFALGVIDVRAKGIPTSFSNFIVLVHTDNFQVHDDVDSDDLLLGYRLLIPDFNADHACVYKDCTILCVPLYGGEDMDKMELCHPGDHILGAGSFDGIPLFFSFSCGVVALKSSSTEESAMSASFSGVGDVSCVVENFNLTCTPSELESFMSSDNKAMKLKAALLLYCRRNLVQCQAVLLETFPLSLSDDVEVDSDLDRAASYLSAQTIDDFPAVDPRWAETLASNESCISSSMIILRQLEDKHKAHQVFVKFLHVTGLWDRLRCVTVYGNQVSTRRLLCEHEEKLVAAKALRLIQPQHAVLVESAIRAVMKTWNVAPSGKLTNQDVFYQQVSKVEDVVPALLEFEKGTVAGGSAADVVATVSSVNYIILYVLRQIAQHRRVRSGDISLVLGPSEIENLPLSGSRDPSVFRSFLIEQYRLTLEHAIDASQDAASKGAFYQQMMDLADSVLDGYRCHLQYLEVRGSEAGYAESVLHKYEQDRPALILPLFQAKQHDRAAALAEKYLDFEVLVRLCEATDSNERLQRYMVQFAEQGFTDFVYNWYLKEGKRGKLLSQPVLQRESLQNFLEDHRNLSWLHDIQMETFARAHRTLKSCALSEYEILARKKTFLSISKLCCLASDALPEDAASELDALNEEQTLIAYQETLPATVLESYGMDPDLMRVLSPVELIEAYVGDENVASNEYDFKKALELLHFVAKESAVEYERLRRHIWCRCILKDNWDEFDKGVDDPLEAGSQTTFFRTVELAFNSGMDLKKLLPSKDVLFECHVLDSLAKNANFQFLVHACYEHIFEVMMM